MNLRLSADESEKCGTGIYIEGIGGLEKEGSCVRGVRKVRRLSKLFTIEYYTIRNTESSVLVAVGQFTWRPSGRQK